MATIPNPRWQQSPWCHSAACLPCPAPCCLPPLVPVVSSPSAGVPRGLVYFLEEQLKYQPKSIVTFVVLFAFRHFWIFGHCRNPVRFHSSPHQVQGAPWMRFSKFFFLWLTSDSPSGGSFSEHSDNWAKENSKWHLGQSSLAVRWIELLRGGAGNAIVWDV